MEMSSALERSGKTERRRVREQVSKHARVLALDRRCHDLARAFALARQRRADRHRCATIIHHPHHPGGMPLHRRPKQRRQWLKHMLKRRRWIAMALHQAEQTRIISNDAMPALAGRRGFLQIALQGEVIDKGGYARARCIDDLKARREVFKHWMAWRLARFGLAMKELLYGSAPARRHALGQVRARAPRRS